MLRSFFRGFCGHVRQVVTLWLNVFLKLNRSIGNIDRVTCETEVHRSVGPFYQSNSGISD